MRAARGADGCVFRTGGARSVSRGGAGDAAPEPRFLSAISATLLYPLPASGRRSVSRPSEGPPPSKTGGREKTRSGRSGRWAIAAALRESAGATYAYYVHDSVAFPSSRPLAIFSWVDSGRSQPGLRLAPMARAGSRWARGRPDVARDLFRGHFGSGLARHAGASRTGSGRNLQQSSLLELHECEALVAGFALTRSDSLHDDSLGRTFSTSLALPCRAGRAGALTVSFSVREGSDPFHAEARRRGARAEDFLRDLRASALPCLPCRVAVPFPSLLGSATGSGRNLQRCRQADPGVCWFQAAAPPL